MLKSCCCRLQFDRALAFESGVRGRVSDGADKKQNIRPLMAAARILESGQQQTLIASIGNITECSEMPASAPASMAVGTVKRQGKAKRASSALTMYIGEPRALSDRPRQAVVLTGSIGEAFVGIVFHCLVGSAEQADRKLIWWLSCAHVFSSVLAKDRNFSVLVACR